MPAPNPLLSVPLSDATERLLRGHERHLQAERKSPRTVQSYGEAARLLAGFLAPDVELDEVTREDIQRFMIYLLEQHSATTAAVRFRSLQQFYGWAFDEEIIDANPMDRLKPPKPGTKPVPVVDDDDLRALVKACAGKDVYDRRDEAMIRLFIDTGMRVSEMTGILVTDLDLKLDQVTVRGKGDKIRILPFGAKTGTALDRYLRLRGRHKLAHLPELWVGARGKPMTPSGVTQMLERRCAMVGLEPINPHRFRHSAAAFLKGNPAAGDDSIMRLMGWSSREMLGRYGSAVADQQAREAHRAIAPGDRI